MPPQGPRILVIAQAWVGDVVLSQILYVLLKQQQPDVQIDVAAPLWAEALLKRMPQVCRHIPLEVRHGQWKFARRWKAALAARGNYQHAIVIPRSLKAALLPWLAGIRRRTGFANEGRRRLINDPRPRPDDAVSRMAQLASAKLPHPLPRPKLAVEPDRTAAVLRQKGLDPNTSTVGLMPGAAYGPAKQWGADAFAELGAMLTKAGRRVCVVGMQRDHALGARIAQAAPEHISNLCGQTTLDEAVELIAGLDAAVCNDSGLMHIAAAVDTPVVGIYGSTSPDTHPPLTPLRKICTERTLCSPCRQRVCPYGHTACMTRITPEQVFAAVSDLLR